MEIHLKYQAHQIHSAQKEHSCTLCSLPILKNGAYKSVEVKRYVWSRLKLHPECWEKVENQLRSFLSLIGKAENE